MFSFSFLSSDERMLQWGVLADEGVPKASDEAPITPSLAGGCPRLDLTTTLPPYTMLLVVVEIHGCYLDAPTSSVCFCR
jgi:hypothetical protein